jgi:hypothetical protein
MKVRAPLPTSRPAPSRDVAEDTRRRFLTAIVARVPLERITEIHIFPPIKQGGMETGFAVVAALPDGYSEPVPTADAIVLEDAVSAASSEAPVADAPGDEAAEAAHEDVADDAHAVVDRIVDDADAAGDSEEEQVADEASATDDSPYAAELPVLDVEELLAPDAVSAEAEPSDDAGADDESLPAERPFRHVVFSARYRLTLKGPERGRWEAEIVAEADAPLVTVDAVVRGVQRRAGEPADAERLDRAALAMALDEFAWKTKTP